MVVRYPDLEFKNGACNVCVFSVRGNNDAVDSIISDVVTVYAFVFHCHIQPILFRIGADAVKERDLRKLISVVCCGTAGDRNG